jgi:hypothetical protein
MQMQRNETKKGQNHIAKAMSLAGCAMVVL